MISKNEALDFLMMPSQGATFSVFVGAISLLSIHTQG
ncbi:Uncharacterised protein [Escherichia coli]|nr:hypothetical protein [Klebsiella michiganensis]UCK64167.1 hypothetical protein FBEKDCPO_00110 [Klebsiella pneumoniae]UHA82387.1 hypothetical protein NNFBJPFD_00133 [Enterobacter cloacae]UMW96720.1 hypothetical protein [Raoultella ornithinolytica]UQW94098.1 hypothetical protein OKNFBMNL_00245 [Klebsiella quasipneumoniae subsp. quasipneumoniae]UQW94504.1 hypothetical protein PCIJMNHK_00273 [Klebsiella variicola]UWX38296.1 hypothetical protein KJK04_p1460 [Klebsiella quasipneumoniae]VVY67845